jgi:hypothetical protein
MKVFVGFGASPSVHGKDRRVTKSFMPTPDRSGLCRFANRA